MCRLHRWSPIWKCSFASFISLCCALLFLRCCVVLQYKGSNRRTRNWRTCIAECTTWFCWTNEEFCPPVIFQFEKRCKFVKQRTGHKFAQQKAASIVGFKKYYNFKHTPHPLRKSTFETFFNDNRDVFINNIKHKFRSINQFTPQGLANHIEIKNNSCVLEKDLKLIYFRSYKKPLFWYNLNLKFKTNKKLFLGLQSLDKCPSNKLKFLLNWLSKRLKIWQKLIYDQLKPSI